MSVHNCKECQLKCAAAKYLNEDEYNVLEEHSVSVPFKKGEIIFKQDALSLNVAYLKSGLAKIHVHGPSHEKIIKIVKAPSYLGIPTMIGDKINQFSATALEDTTVCFIDTNLFVNFIHTNGKFAYELILELSRNELSDYQRYVSISQKQIPGMVAETLLCLSCKIYESCNFSLPISRSEIGDLIGTSRESVSRVLTDFSNEKIIEINLNEVKILNMERLKQINEKG